jgi:predicted DNA-binding transcriptional regulator YafY
VQSRTAWYLLATRDGAERTYRLSRLHDAQVLDEPAQRPAEVDLGQLWEARRSGFTDRPGLAVRVRVPAGRRAELVAAARSLRSSDGAELEVEFTDAGHAEAVLWMLQPDVEVLDPPGLRAALRRRALATAECQDQRGGAG